MCEDHEIDEGMSCEVARSRKVVVVAVAMSVGAILCYTLTSLIISVNSSSRLASQLSYALMIWASAFAIGLTSIIWIAGCITRDHQIFTLGTSSVWFGGWHFNNLSRPYCNVLQLNFY